MDSAKYIDVLIPIYNSKEYSNIYWKTSGRLWQCCRDEPALDASCAVIDLVYFKQKITVQTGNNCIKYVETMVPL